MLVPASRPVKRSQLLLPQPVRNETLKFQVARILQKAIFSGQFQPGQTLRELALAKQLDVSQATIREALAHLEQLGLVVKEANRGTAVTNLSPAEVRDRLSIRIVLEELAAVEAAKKMTDDDFEELEAHSRSISAAIGRNEYFDVSQADIAFHRVIWRKSGNVILERTLDQLTTPLFAFLGVLHQIAAEDQRKTKPHSEIIDAFRTRELRKVRAAIREHISGSYGVFLESEAADLHTLLNGATEK